MRAFCCECGKAVPSKIIGDKREFGRCREHPDALRFKAESAEKLFNKLRAEVDAVKNRGQCYHTPWGFDQEQHD